MVELAPHDIDHLHLNHHGASANQSQGCSPSRTHKTHETLRTSHATLNSLYLGIYLLLLLSIRMGASSLKLEVDGSDKTEVTRR